MIDRVTEGAFSRQLLANVGVLQRRLAELQSVVSSQKRLQLASDDPAGAALATRLRGDVSRLQAFKDGVGLGVVVLGAQDAALDQANAVVLRAREIAAQYAGGLSSAVSRQAAAEEVEQLERELLALGNSVVAGRYLFGGLVVNTPPFAGFDDPGFDPAAPYTGPATAFEIPVGADERVRLSTPGDQVFGAAIQALDDLRQTLAAGNDPAVVLDALESAGDGIRIERTSVGGRLARLSDRQVEIRSAVDGARVRLGDVEDADLTESIVELTQLQNALNVTLAAGQALLRTSILDFVQV